MLSDELKNRLVSFFDLDRDEYRESHGYLAIGEDQYQHIIDTAKKAIKTIFSFSDIDGFVAVDKDNVAMLLECIYALNTCMHHRNSWCREATILLAYQFLSNFRWTGIAPEYVGYDGWGPLIYELSSEQLAYYLWWREEAKDGMFHEATGEYLWLYIYDTVLNTCYNDSNQSLDALQKLYNSYSRLSPVVTHKRLSHQKLGYFIVNYALYNGITHDIDRLLKTYGMDDTFYIYNRVAIGCFNGIESHLVSLASSVVRTKVFENSEEKDFVLTIIARVYEQINKICKEYSINLLGDICGTFNDHALWAPYESPVLSARSAVKTVASNKHVSFAIGDNYYIYATNGDFSSDRELANSEYGFYYNDHGRRFHCKGFYYRKEYSGPNETAQSMVDYVIRKIQISCRSLFGGRTVKELICPYKEIKSKVDQIIYSLVQEYYPIWKQNHESTTMIELQYKELAEDQISIPSRFKYVRNISKCKEANMQAKGMNLMSEIKKAAALREKFEILKDQYSEKDKNSTVFRTLATKIIVPMLELDFDAGCKMWEYVLLRYFGECPPVYYHTFTDGIVELSQARVLAKVFHNNETIKQHVFLLDPYENHLNCEWFIRDLILLEEYDLADELITLYSQNNHGDNNPEKNLYSVLYEAVNSSESKWGIHSAGIDFLNRWIAKVQPKTKRAELEVALLSLIDCVEGNASKGSMPLSLFLTEGSFQMLIEDRLKMSNAQDTQDNFGGLIETRAKSTMIKPIGKENKEECQEKKHPSEIFDIEELEKSLTELTALIGLQEVKAEITSLANLMRIRCIRSERGMKVPDTSQHLVFSGNPGTGKTTVARIIGKVYHALGFFSILHLVEVDRSGLVAGYVGQTAIKTQEVIQSALGGILFIDEAYSLSMERSENDFGQEAIDTILKAMEDHRDDFVVIVAGYDNLMPQFIDSNPGLRSRFNKYISFPDYTGTELFSIFKVFLEKNDYVIDNDAARLIAEYLERIYRNRNENFGNARDVRNLFEKVIANQANRLVNNHILSNDIIARITVEDLQNIV